MSQTLYITAHLAAYAFIALGIFYLLRGRFFSARARHRQQAVSALLAVVTIASAYGWIFAGQPAADIFNPNPLTPPVAWVAFTDQDSGVQVDRPTTWQVTSPHTTSGELELIASFTAPTYAAEGRQPVQALLLRLPRDGRSADALAEVWQSYVRDNIGPQTWIHFEVAQANSGGREALVIDAVEGSGSQVYLDRALLLFGEQDVFVLVLGLRSDLWPHYQNTFARMMDTLVLLVQK